MNKNFTRIALLGMLLIGTSCASIVSKSSYPIMISSTPSEAKVSITNKKGKQVFIGKTPTVVKLESGSGFFSKAHYQVLLEKPGYEPKTVPVTFKVDGWYFGNILFGGLIGMLIVDPATGAMYKLDTEFINETMQTQENIIVGTEKEERALKVYTLNDIPEQWKSHLTLVH
ncbi:PEGA domain-containing protein [Sinomicrobium oceani]|uniref:PEGA domain-containing protein n=1 Tax=Sinomicrobium oceani TaxID=1150368 RepID=A0A1K1Q5W8_9FLAO|nr:PEGA domain-containing protein [Sinomicrobium oceani]SFW54518.1 PEGA domain-containing protein [Sinomicrobium oceani]